MENLDFSYLKRNVIPIVLAFFGIIFIGIGLFSVIKSDNSGSAGLQYQAGAGSATSSASNTGSSHIVVDIEGGVIKPGIYSIAENSRVHDLLVACGGLSGDADRAWVQKNLNQAAKLVDSQKIYIPRNGESILTGASTSSIGSQDSAPGLISINSASLSELDSLPGIGLVTAQKIVDNRPYSGIEDLVSKKVVSASVFAKIKDKISN